MPSDLTDSDRTDRCADIQAQLAAYALGEVEADTALLTHLSLCAECQEALRAYVQVSWMLAYHAPDVAPPPALRARILAAAAEESTAPAVPDAAGPARESLPRRRGLLGRRPAFAFAFAALAFVALLGWNLVLRGQVAELSAAVDEDHQSWRTMIGLLNDPAVQWYSVAGAQAHGHFWAAPQSKVGCLVAQGLPKLASGQIYHVWLFQGQQFTSVGVFNAFDGNGWVLIHSDKPLSSYNAVGVTAESRDGSSAPSGAPVLQGSLTASEKPSSYERRETISMLAQIVLK